MKQHPRHPHLACALTLGLLGVVCFVPRQPAAQTSTKPVTAGKPGADPLKAAREIILPDRGGQHGMSPFFTPDSAALLWWDGKGIAIWDLTQEKVVGSIEPAFWQFVMSADGKKLSTDMQITDDNGRIAPVIKIYDIATRKELHQLSRPPGGGAKEVLFRTCGFDRKGDKLFTRTDLDLQAWDVKTGKMLRRIAMQKPPVNNASYLSPGGQYLTVDDGQPDIHVLDTRTEGILRIRTGRQDLGVVLGKPKGGYISSLGGWSFSADGLKLYGTDQINGALLTFALPQGKMIKGVKIPELLFVKVSPDTTRILATYRDQRNILRVLDGKSHHVIATLGPVSRDVAWWAMSPDNRWVFVSSVGDTRMWDLGAASAKAKKK